jgi:hypothetical protein
MKKIAIWALPLAATFALTGCSGLLGSDNKESVQPRQAATPETSASESTEAPPLSDTTPAAETTTDSGFSTDAGPNHSASADQLSADELTEVAGAIESYNGQSAIKIVGDVESKALAAQSEKQLASSEVIPAVCAVYSAAAGSDMISHLNIITATFAGDSNDAGVSVSLGSYDDPADVQTMIGKAKTSSENCSSFTMTVLSQTVTATVEELPATTNAATTIGTVADLKSGEQYAKNLIVSGYDGVNTVSVSISEPKDLDTARAKAEEYVDQGLLHIAGY